MEKTEPVVRELPVVPLRGIVLFPGTTMHFEVIRQKSYEALKRAMDTDQYAFFVSQKDPAQDHPKLRDLYTVGCVGRVKQILRTSDHETLRVIVEGLYRARVTENVPVSKYLSAVVTACEAPNPDAKELYERAVVRHAHDLFFRYLDYVENIAADVVFAVEGCSSPGPLSDQIASAMLVDFREKQQILEELAPVRRLETLCVLLMNELEVGKNYEIIITNFSGLYRYRIMDIVKVTGYYNNAPKIEFR